MSKELYLKIPKKINYFLQQIKDQDPFLYEYMDQVYNIIKNADPPLNKKLVQGPLAYISEEDTILLVAEFLNCCNSEYRGKLLKDYKEGKVIFSKEGRSRIVGNTKKEKFKIMVEKTNTIQQAQELVHEFFHRLNGNNFVMNLVFTETVSLTAELMFLNFLREKGYNEYDLNMINQKIKATYSSNLQYLKIMLPLYLEQKKHGNIPSSFYNEMVMNQNISAKELKKNLFFLLETPKHGLSVYRYTMGYILAKTFFYNHKNPEVLQEINELLYKQQITQFQRTIIGANNIEDIHKFATREDFLYRPAKFIKR